MTHMLMDEGWIVKFTRSSQREHQVQFVGCRTWQSARLKLVANREDLVDSFSTPFLIFRRLYKLIVDMTL